MIDHIAGRPSPSWKRTQVFLVIIFWLWRILRGDPSAPRYLWLRRANRLLGRFTPWQLIVSTLTAVYALRNLDKILGLGSPEPLARLYSPSYYRATWIATGLDAGFATAMSIRPKWLRDICSILFAVYYTIYANEGDEKLRRFRAVPTVEMLRVTWEKTSNRYIRFFIKLPNVVLRRRILLPRHKSSQYRRPVTAYLFFARPENELCEATDLVLDFPGGGFVAMSPEHHEERLRAWALRTGRPVLSIDYGKAPEYPYPFAIDEAFDVYRVLVESAGAVIGMSGRKLNIIISGDSAGATIAVTVVIKVLEHNAPSLGPPLPPTAQLPKPLALLLNYAALDFNFTSWMSPTHLRVLRSEQSSGNLTGLRGLAEQKDHLQHISPLSMVGDKRPRARKRLRRRTSWRDTLRALTSREDVSALPLQKHASTGAVQAQIQGRPALGGRRGMSHPLPSNGEDKGDLADAESEEEDNFEEWREEDRPIEARVRYLYEASLSPTGNGQEQAQADRMTEPREAETKVAMTEGKGKEPIGTRLTMTSRTGYFQDRIISPSMMRAMAILYIGPHRNPDFATDYLISPILAPASLLAQFPPLLMQCGEKDPFVDDTVIFAGRVREAKRARRAELDLLLAGKSARFGESLRMSAAESSVGMEGSRSVALKREREQLAREGEEDWVQMVLFSDWSHGYLQMGSLMKEARAVIDELGEWIDDAFERYVRNGISEGGGVNGIGGTSYGVGVGGGRGGERKARWGGGGGGTTGGMRASPITSETEDDSSVITFVARKHTRSPTLESEAVGTETDLARITDGVSSGSEGKGVKEDGARPVEEGPVRGGKGGKGGATISETELLRRRRLVDWHVFD